MTKQEAIDTVNKFMALLLTDFPECAKLMADDFGMGKLSTGPYPLWRPLRGCGGIAKISGPTGRDLGDR